MKNVKTVSQLYNVDWTNAELKRLEKIRLRKQKINRIKTMCKIIKNLRWNN